MAQLNIKQAFDQALAFQNTGHFADAESLFQRILAADPTHIDAMQMLGVLMAQSGRIEPGLALVRQASRLNPQAASCHGNIGMILANQGQLEPAMQSFRRAVELRPDLPDAHNNLANALGALGRIDQAIASYEKAIALNRNFAQAHNNLGTVLCGNGRAEEGIARFRKAIAIKPDYAEAHFNLAKALYEIRDLQTALEVVQNAIAVRPTYADALTLRGVLLQTHGAHDEAINAYSQSLSIRPNDSETLNNLATAYLEQRKYDLAIETYRRAIAANPANAEPYGNLGRALGEVGELDQALSLYRQSLKLKPQSRTASGMLLYLHLHPEITPTQILDEHRSWNTLYARPLAGSQRPHQNNADPHRRIRIGYISPDFTNHPVGRFMHPILSNHDHHQFEVVCYSDTRATDFNTDRLRKHADLWRDTSKLTDKQLAKQVRDDRIDLLIDLVMHSKGCRLLAFAEKPAPVQISYLAYASTTGIDAMDYRISDPFLDPIDSDLSVYSEKTLRLPHSLWCFEPSDPAPAVAPLPASINGYVTFGCLNNFWKVTPPVFELWLDLLEHTSHSRLVLHAHEGSHRQRVRQKLIDRKLDPDRVSFIPFLPMADYLQQHTQIDIALDTFPYAGGTTTCEAMWMGAPVVSTTGQTAVSRAGLSILSNLGLERNVAQNPEAYLAVALSLAKDISALAELRSTLRDRMRSSPLMDGPQFTRDLESLFQNAWKSWCANH